MLARRILFGVTIDDSLQFLRGFPEHMVSAGWEVHVVSTPGPRLERLRSVPGVHVHGLPMTRNPSAVRDCWALLCWITLLMRVRPTVISVGTPKAGLLGGVAGWLLRVPVRVYLLRGLRMETTTGLQRWLLCCFERISAFCATSVVAVSQSLSEKVVSLGICRHSKLCVIGSGSSNGVDTEVFDRRQHSGDDLRRLRVKLGVRGDRPVVGYVGRLTHDKGIMVLAEAMMLLKKRGVDTQLLVLGGVDDISGQEGVDAIREVLGGSAIIAGKVDNTAPYYPLMDLLCLPTYREGFPNAVLEAASSCVPTVTTDATGAVDSVVNGITGAIVKTGSAESLADAVERILGNSELTTDMGLAARQDIEMRYSRAVVWADTAKFYLNAIEAASKAGNPSGRANYVQ